MITDATHKNTHRMGKKLEEEIMKIQQVANKLWIINGDVITADTKEEAIKKYYEVRSQI